MSANIWDLCYNKKVKRGLRKKSEVWKELEVRNINNLTTVRGEGEDEEGEDEEGEDILKYRNNKNTTHNVQLTRQTIHLKCVSYSLQTSISFWHNESNSVWIEYSLTFLQPNTKRWEPEL